MHYARIQSGLNIVVSNPVDLESFWNARAQTIKSPRGHTPYMTRIKPSGVRIHYNM